MIQTFDGIFTANKPNVATFYIELKKDNRYLYVVRTRDEANRVVEECDTVSFKTLNIRPQLNQSEALELLLSVGASIAIVPDEFYMLTTDMVQSLIRYDYRIIIGADVDLFKFVEIYQDDLQLVTSAGWLNREFGEFGVTYESVKDGKHNYSGGLMEDLFAYADVQKVATLCAPSEYTVYIYPVGWQLIVKNLIVVFSSPIRKGSKTFQFLKLLGIPINVIKR